MSEPLALRNTVPAGNLSATANRFPAFRASKAESESVSWRVPHIDKTIVYIDNREKIIEMHHILLSTDQIKNK